MLVLLAEDDQDLAELIIEHLNDEGLECDLAYNGEMALNLIAQQSFDVLVTDIMMPKLDGLSLCERLRQQGNAIPCLMLTSRDSLADKLEGFAKGTDDYLVKPFELAELSARIKSLGSRQQRPGQQLQVGNLSLHSQQRSAQRGSRALQLSANEFKLLELLMRESPNLVSRPAIESHIWPDQEPSADAYKMLVYRLRRQIDGDQDTPLLHTQRGQGLTLSNEP